jgi:hypothetical protein
MTVFHFDCRRWFDRRCGNTYFTVEIFKDGKFLHVLPMSYGYGEQCVYEAFQYLANGHIDALAGEVRFQYCDRTGDRITYSIADVSRRGDLHLNGKL